MLTLCTRLYLLGIRYGLRPASVNATLRTGRVEETPFHGQNSMLTVEIPRELHPRYAWRKTFVFVLTIGRESTDRCFWYTYCGNPCLSPWK
jgi:hypothetical protein